MGEVSTPMVVPALSTQKEHAALITMIIERLVLKKADLFWFFANVDELHNGRVSRVYLTVCILTSAVLTHLLPCCVPTCPYPDFKVTMGGWYAPCVRVRFALDVVL